MPKVTYVEYNGNEHTVYVPVGTSVMRGAVDNNALASMRTAAASALAQPATYVDALGCPRSARRCGVRRKRPC
jgi:hypothetical protein